VNISKRCNFNEKQVIPGVMFPETNAVRLTMPFNLLVPGLKACGGLKFILVLVLFQLKGGGMV
jgi:hypothetical protein